jgi:hypothetical protein
MFNHEVQLPPFLSFNGLTGSTPDSRRQYGSTQIIIAAAAVEAVL